MGTRSVVGYAEGDGFRGRYHHWDGYPTSKGVTLHAILHRTFMGDAEAMLKVLCEDYAGWSSTNEDPNAAMTGDRDGRFIQVPGVGTAYNSEPMTFMGEVGYRQIEPDDWRTHMDTDTDCEWAYAIHPASLTCTVFEHRCDDYDVHWSERVYRWVPVGFVNLRSPDAPEAFQRIETECFERQEAEYA